MLRFLFIFLLFFFAATLICAELPVISLSSEKTNLTSKSFYFEDKSASLTADEAFNKKLLKIQTNSIGFGFNSSDYWFFFSLKNSLEKKLLENYILTLTYPALDFVEVYQQKESGFELIDKAGDLTPFSKRKIKSRFISFSVPISSKPAIFAVKVRSNSSKYINIYIENESTFFTSNQNDLIQIGFFIGFILIMVFYHLLLFIGLRDSNYLYYAFLVAGYCVWHLSIQGIGAMFLWEENTFWTDISVPFFIALSLVTSSVFARSFLETKVTMKKTDKFIFAIIILGLVNMGICFWGSYPLAIQMATPASILCTLFLCWLGLKAYLRGAKYALSYIAGWLSYQIGTTIYAVSRYGVLSSEDFINYIQQGGAAFYVFFISISIGSKIKFLKKEKETYALETIKTLEFSSDEIRKRNALFESAIEKLKAQDNANNRFLRLISHEVGTPINGLTGMSFLLSEEAQSPEMKKNINSLKNSIDRIKRFCSASLILTNSKISEKELSLRETFLAEPFFYQILSRLENSKNESEIIFATEISPTAEITADKEIFSMIVESLIDSAIIVSCKSCIIKIVLENEKENIVVKITTSLSINHKKTSHSLELFNEESDHTVFENSMNLETATILSEIIGARLEILRSNGIESFRTNLFIKQHIA